MMKKTDLDHLVSISHLHQLIGGNCTESGDMLVAKNAVLAPDNIGFPFRSNAMAFVLCTSGSCDVDVYLRKKKMERGSFMVYGRENIVEFGPEADNPVFHMLLFSNKLIEDMMIDMKSIMPIARYTTESPDNLLKLTSAEITLVEKFYDLLFDLVKLDRKVILCDILSAMLRTISEMYNKRLPAELKPISRQEEYFERFVSAVAESHTTQRSVKYYADALHITPKYLSTIIKEVSGKSATSWINDFVIQQAKAQLKFSGKSIQEITYEMNFSTQSFFGKYFKRHTGMSPSEYRQQY